MPCAKLTTSVSMIMELLPVSVSLPGTEPAALKDSVSDGLLCGHLTNLYDLTFTLKLITFNLQCQTDVESYIGKISTFSN